MYRKIKRVVAALAAAALCAGLLTACIGGKEEAGFQTGSEAAPAGGSGSPAIPGEESGTQVLSIEQAGFSMAIPEEWVDNPYFTAATVSKRASEREVGVAVSEDYVIDYKPDATLSDIVAYYCDSILAKNAEAEPVYGIDEEITVGGAAGIPAAARTARVTSEGSDLLYEVVAARDEAWFFVICFLGHPEAYAEDKALYDEMLATVAIEDVGLPAASAGGGADVAMQTVSADDSKLTIDIPADWEETDATEKSYELNYKAPGGRAQLFFLEMPASDFEEVDTLEEFTPFALETWRELYTPENGYNAVTFGEPEPMTLGDGTKAMHCTVTYWYDSIDMREAHILFVTNTRYYSQVYLQSKPSAFALQGDLYDSILASVHYE
ncbi:MAG: hypothetical protein LBR44_03850 [Clostridiales Family XIII bacterium]|nr:hypothetical protein [Clostridiales Family XIII bacterium]